MPVTTSENFAPSPLLSSIIETAHRAGELALRMLHSSDLEISQKGPRNFVTSADIAVDHLIRKSLDAAVPGARWMSEELAPEESDTSGDLWVVDPIDGTTNFTYGGPHVGVSIAFARSGVVQAGVVYCPFTSETFAAELGKGSYLACSSHLGWERLAVRAPCKLEDCLIATGLPYKRTPEVLNRIVPRISKLIAASKDIRRLGACSLDLCWVASGRIDAYWENVNPWDMAAGGLIAREAGAIIKSLTFSDDQKATSTRRIPADLNGRNLLAAHPEIIEQLENLLV